MSAASQAHSVSYYQLSMSDDDESQHLFAITSELPDDFGYTAGFLNGTLKFDFTSSTGGGRHTAAAVVEKCADLGI